MGINSNVSAETRVSLAASSRIGIMIWLAPIRRGRRRCSRRRCILVGALVAAVFARRLQRAVASAP
jgi:hypothetical protein